MSQQQLTFPGMPPLQPFNPALNPAPSSNVSRHASRQASPERKRPKPDHPRTDSDDEDEDLVDQILSPAPNADNAWIESRMRGHMAKFAADIITENTKHLVQLRDTLYQQLSSEMHGIRDNLLSAIGKQANQIANLESQVTALRLNNAAAITPQSNKPIAKTTTTPAKPSYRDAVAPPSNQPAATQQPAPNESEFTTVQKKRKAAPKPKLIGEKYPIAEREVIITFEKAPDAPTFTPMQADICLMKVNKAMINSKDITLPPFARARFSFTDQLILTTGFNHRGLDYESYLSIISQPLTYLGTPAARVRERWSKFLLHGVPTDTELETIRTDIETTYPMIRLGQTPRWLTTAAKREGKSASSVVITVVGDLKTADFGTNYLYIRNRDCTLQDYIDYGPTTQCKRCQLYGHPAQMCKADLPTCAVCNKSHLTKDHPCTITSCKAGPTCTHPPIACASCGDGHKSTDPNCPKRTIIAIQTREAREKKKAATAAEENTETIDTTMQ